MFWYLDSYSNLAKAGTIAASSANAYFPVANINGSALACDVWRSAVGAAGSTETLTIPLGAGYVAADFPNGLDLLVDSWNANSVCTLLEATLIGPGTVQELTPSPIVPAAPGRFTIYLDPATPTTAVVLTFTRNATPGTFVQVGKILLGKPYDSGAEGTPDNAGFTRVFNELVNKDKSVLGQSFSEKRAAFWSASLALPVVGEAVETKLRAFFEELGTHTPFWLIVVPTDYTTSQLGLPRYCKLTTPPQEKSVAFGAGYIWALSLSLEKQL